MFLKRISRGLVAVGAAVVFSDARAQLAGMPNSADHSSIWWAEGFPKVVEGAPWLRVIETADYALALNTETLKIPHFGPLENKSWRDLPEGDLNLEISVSGKTYRCKGSRGWSRHGGPRLVEAGRFFQRADVTELIFESSTGEALNGKARLETVAWPDRLSFVFDAEPGKEAIVAGEGSFGKVGGGFGLDGSNFFLFQKLRHFNPNSLTWAFWAFVPEGYDSATKAFPWLMTDGLNEARDGHMGIYLSRGKAVATINVGGGRENQVRVTSENLRVGKWNHFMLSYDGKEMRFHVNSIRARGGKVGKARRDPKQSLIFGRRGDEFGDGYHFVGVIDEVQFFHQVIEPDALAQAQAAKERGFQKDGNASEARPKEAWNDASLSLSVKMKSGRVNSSTGPGRQVVSFFDPNDSEKASPDWKVEAKGCPVTFEPEYSWYRVNLDRVKPIGRGNDVIERIPFTVSHSGASEQVVRLMFEKTGRGFRGRLGSPITGVSAILCDENGEPTGIPIQLSKNWHNEVAAGVYKGNWFHGITQIRVPPGQLLKFQLVIANAHWGGVAAASHAQLSLIGWGSNQRWEQSALGCWGESLCYEPAQGQANCTVTDVRPLMVTPMKGEGKWSWTHNVGGGDFFRVFDRAGKRMAHRGVKTITHRQGPCLTEVEFRGRVGDAIQHSVTTSLARTDDLVRGCYRLRMDVTKAVDFSRFVVFQVGADTYNFTREGRLASGNAGGVTYKKKIEAGETGYGMKPFRMDGENPWISLEQGKPGNPQHDKGAWANRGIVVRGWKARVDGKPVACHFAEHRMKRGRSHYSTVDLVLPPEIKSLKPGDFVEAVVEYVVMPQKVGDYYGPNESLKGALSAHGGTWEMIRREAVGNRRKVEVMTGSLLRTFPDVRIACENDEAKLKLSGGLGYVPITFTGLSCHDGFVLKVNGQAVDQSVHGNDFWQTDYDAESKTWSRTYNLSEKGLVEFQRM